MLELGDAMNLMATANDDGSVTLSWTAGANATHHFVAGTDGAWTAADVDVWEYSSGHGSPYRVRRRTGRPVRSTSSYVWSGYSKWMEAAAGEWSGEWAGLQHRHGHRQLASSREWQADTRWMLDGT